MEVCTASRSVGHLVAVFALGSCTSNSISSVVSSAVSRELWAFLAAWGGRAWRGGKEKITKEEE